MNVSSAEKGMRMMVWLKRWGPAILLMAVIFLISGTPGSDLPDLGGWDLLTKKGGHLLGYALLASAFYFAVNWGKRSTRLQVILAAFMAVLYATSDEWHQKFVPGRNSSLIDVCIDAIGGLIGIAIYCLVRRSLRSREAAAVSSPK